jgi:flagellar hook-associated protein 1
MSLLSIGKSGLFAAQAALSTTGHNIANANVAGYSRQVVVQATSTPMQTSGGFIGSGTQIAQVKRYSDEFLNAQVRTAQAQTSGLQAYQSQITQIDNLLADSTSGVSPRLLDFFQSVQNLTGDRAGVPSRGSLLTSADTLAASFQSMDKRLGEIRNGVNTQLTSSVESINTYAAQIAKLNDQIGKLSAGNDLQLPNDLLDQRDQLVMELNKQVKATVVAGDNNSLTVSIGSGQPLVVGTKAYELAAVPSATDQARLTIGYVTGSKVSPLAESALTGGALGAVLEFRTKSLDLAQNSLGRIAIAMATTINDQHHLGLDANGNPGGDFFTVPQPEVTKNVNNNKTSTTAIKATITDATKLTTSDYKVEFDGSAYNVFRLSDNQKTVITTNPQEVDGVSYAISGTADRGDDFLVRPTINGASNMKVALTDQSQIAAAAPIATSFPLTNKGTGKISEGVVDKNYLASPLAAGAPVTLTYNTGGANGMLTGFPAGQQIVMTIDGKPQPPYPAGSAVPFKDGASYTFGGMTVTMNGAPTDQDTFKIERNSGTGDTRNAGLIGDLQDKNILDGGKATYQSAYANLVSAIGNKTREVQVNAAAAEAQLEQAQGAANNVSGVNLDEEAANLLKYQQAYQASGKVMQIADTIFDTLLSIGH